MTQGNQGEHYLNFCNSEPSKEIDHRHVWFYKSVAGGGSNCVFSNRVRNKHWIWTTGRIEQINHQGKQDEQQNVTDDGWVCLPVLDLSRFMTRNLVGRPFWSWRLLDQENSIGLPHSRCYSNQITVRHSLLSSFRSCMKDQIAVLIDLWLILTDAIDLVKRDEAPGHD
jgi:hypothetical protein